MARLRNKARIDESLDVWACHGMGGTWGAIATGIFASGALTSTGGLINGNWMQMLLQILATAVTWLSPSS